MLYTRSTPSCLCTSSLVFHGDCEPLELCKHVWQLVKETVILLFGGAIGLEDGVGRGDAAELGHGQASELGEHRAQGHSSTGATKGSGRVGDDGRRLVGCLGSQNKGRVSYNKGRVEHRASQLEQRASQLEMQGRRWECWESK